MPFAEKISNISLSTYGLRLNYFSGLNLPPYKDLMPENPLNLAELKILQEQQIDIKLVGKYLSKSDLATNIVLFTDQVRSAVKQIWLFEEHSFEGNCVVKNGIDVSVFGNSEHHIAVVSLTLSVTILEA